MSSKFFSFTVVFLAALLLPAFNNEAIGSPDIGYAILVGGEGGWREQWIINSNADAAYRALASVGFDDSRIRYLTGNSYRDADYDGDNDADMTPTLCNFEYVMEWARNHVGPDSPLIIYLVGHGTEEPEIFFLSEPETQGFGPCYLNWQFGLCQTGTPIIVIIDACYSGCFITGPDTISAPERVIITASHDDGEVLPYFNWFSHEFWSQVEQGVDIRQGFIDAAYRANHWHIGQPVNPWLDDNGDALGYCPEYLVANPPTTEGDVGWLAANTTIGTYGGAPSIGEGPVPAAPFEDCYTRNGGSSILGYPINKVHQWWDGYIQDFRGGEGYEGAIMQPDGENDAYAIYGAIWAKYLSKGGAGGSLGYPVTDENDLPDSSVTGCGCRYNEFQGGAIIYRKPTEDYNDLTAFLGWGIYLKWQDLGYGDCNLGVPVSDEYEAAQSGASGFDTTGVGCDFEGGHMYWHRTGFWADNALEVHGEIDQVYQNEGGPGSWLGYPITDIYTNDSNYPEGTFQGGYITTTDGINYQTYPWTSLPAVQTNPATSVSSTSAIIHGQIIDDGGSSIVERRFDWGSTPSCCDGWTADVTVSDSNFTYYLGGLQSGTKYYFRAWAKNADGWSHGASLSFTTVAVQGSELSADFNTDYIVNFDDFATLASSWMADPDDINWNASCDISDPADDIIDVKDISKFAQYWLLERFPYSGITTRVSVSSSGQQGSSDSLYPSISADGRYVAFESIADNLVQSDTNGDRDVFVHDRQTGQTTRVSVSSSSQQGDRDSDNPSISADGRYVAFESIADNLVQSDTNGDRDVFVHDRQTGQTTRVSVSSAGEQGNHSSYQASISADGRYVAFQSFATNLVDGDTNGDQDVFVHDSQTAQTTRVSISSAGQQGNRDSDSPSISAYGRYVAFESLAFNLVEGDTNGDQDIFVHDRQTGTTSRVSVRSTGLQGNDHSYRPSISADGRYVAFESEAGNLVEGDTNHHFDVFVCDRQTGQTTRVSVSSAGEQGNDTSEFSSISPNGRYVAFRSEANNLVEGDTNGGLPDVFVHDRQTGQTTLVSVSSDGEQENYWSCFSSISAGGRYVAFDSYASNLVEGDTNGYADVFVHDRFASSLSDLVVSDICTQPAPPNAADFTDISIQIENQGLGDAIETFLLEFWFDVTYIGHVYVDGLEAGDTYTSTWYGILWPGDTNNHTLKGVVDPENAITEYIETNNQLSEQFAAPSPPTGTGTLKIQSNPGDACVYIDNEYKGQTPVSGYLTITDLAAGDHDLKVTKLGYNDWTDVVIIPPEGTNYEAVILQDS